MQNDFIEEILSWNKIAITEETKQSREQAFNLIKEEYEEFLEAYEAQDKVEELDALCDMIWVIVGYANNQGYDIVGALDNVAESNFSKFVETMEEAEAQVEYLDTIGVEDAYYTQDLGSKLFILKDGNNKVRKPSTYIPADVSEFTGE